MVIVKFILVILLFYLTFLIVTMDERTQPRSGPYYYLNMEPAGEASIQRRYRISKAEAAGRNHVLEVECFNDGTPYRITKIDFGVRSSSRYFLIDGYKRLRYIGYDDGWGYIRLRQIMPEPND